MHRGGEILRNSTQSEPTGSDGHVVVEKPVKRSLRVGVNLAHVERLTTDYPNASERRPELLIRESSADWTFHFMATKTLAHQLAEYACSLQFEDLSKEVVHEVKRRVIDSLGCALGAWNEDHTVIPRTVWSGFSGNT